VNAVKEFLLTNIPTIIDTFDAHDVGIQRDGRYHCACGWLGSDLVWREHLAEAMADAINEHVVQLPLMDAI
jgi:hypothetical protein